MICQMVFASRMLNDIKHFGNPEDKYRKFVNVFKKYFTIQYQEMEKTSLIQQICQQVINEFDGLVFVLMMKLH